MYMKYVRLLFLIWASIMYVGCSEDPFDWSGDSERSVPIPVNLILELSDGIFWASCGVEQHDNDLPILEAGFFYDEYNGKVTYDNGKRVKATVTEGRFSCQQDGIKDGHCYIGAYITTSQGTVTIGPELIE